MRSYLKIILAGFTTALTLSTAASSVKAATLAYWNFNTLTAGSPPSNANQTSYTPTTGAGTLTLGGVN